MRSIAALSEAERMDHHIRKVYVPMTETGFYILLCLREEENRKIYHITELGSQVLDLEMKRIERLYRSMMEAR